MACVDEKYEYWSGYALEYYFVVGICWIFSIIYSIYIFTCRKQADRPWIVTYIWLLIDAAIISGAICIIFWEHGGYYEQNTLSQVSFQISFTLVIIMHFVFAMEYFSAAIRLPIIMQICSTDAEYRWNLTNRKIWTANIIFYAAVVIWLSMFQIPMTERQYAWIFVMGSLVL